MKRSLLLTLTLTLTLTLLIPACLSTGIEGADDKLVVITHVGSVPKSIQRGLTTITTTLAATPRIEVTETIQLEGDDPAWWDNLVTATRKHTKQKRATTWDPKCSDEPWLARNHHLPVVLPIPTHLIVIIGSDAVIPSTLASSPSSVALWASRTRVGLTFVIPESVSLDNEWASVLGDPEADRSYNNKAGFSMGGTLQVLTTLTPTSLQTSCLNAGVWTRILPAPLLAAFAEPDNDADDDDDDGQASFLDTYGIDSSLWDDDDDDEYADSADSQPSPSSDADDGDGLGSLRFTALNLKAPLGRAHDVLIEPLPPLAPPCLHSMVKDVYGEDYFASRPQRGAWDDVHGRVDPEVFSKEMKGKALDPEQADLRVRPPLLTSGVEGGGVTDELEVTDVPVVVWQKDTPFVDEFVTGSHPVILRGTIVSEWAALSKWNEQYLSRATGRDGAAPMQKVKIHYGPRGPGGSFPFFDVDFKQSMAQLDTLDLAPKYVEEDYEEDPGKFWSHVFRPDEDMAVQHFAEMDPSLLDDVVPNELIFRTKTDAARFMQYFWIGSNGTATHLHYDMDYNYYAQVTGEKTFYMFADYAHGAMYPYPRTHPLWHKSQVHFAAPQANLFPQFFNPSVGPQRVYRASLRPGDVLFVPPYWWHHVVSEHESVSLASFSRVEETYAAMNAVYGLDTPVDTPGLTKSEKHGVLRQYITAVVDSVFGVGQTQVWAAHLLTQRYHTFAPDFYAAGPAGSQSRDDLCGTHVRLTNDAQKEIEYLAARIRALVANMAMVPRDVLVSEYLEEVIASTVHLSDSYQYLSLCFM